MCGEKVRGALQRVVIGRAGGNGRLRESALVELLAMRDDVGSQGNANRAAGVSRRVDDRRGLIGLIRRDAVIGRGHDRNEDQRQPDAQQHS